MKPVPQKFRLTDRHGFSSQDQERGLEGVFRRMTIAKYVVADNTNDPMAVDQGRERDLRRLAAIGDEWRGSSSPSLTPGRVPTS